MDIVKKLIDKSLFPIKSDRKMKPKYITIHNTANKASALNEYKYAFVNAGVTKHTGWHWAVDDKEAIQAIPNTRTAWHAGDGYGAGNMLSIGIEICYSTDYKSDRFYKAIDNAVILTKMLMDEYDIPLNHVVRHYDWSHKHCPHRMMDEGLWENFKERLGKEVKHNMKIINKNGGDKELRKVSDVFSVYVKEGTVPDIKYYTKRYGTSTWHFAKIKPKAGTILTLDYRWDSTTAYVSDLKNDYMLKNGFKRAVAVNGGYFEMRTGKPVGGLMHNWEAKWATYHDEPLEPAKGKGYPTIYADAEIGGKLHCKDGWASEFDLGSMYWARSVGQSLVLNGQVDSRMGQENGRYDQRNCDAMIGQTKDNDYILAVNTVNGMTHVERASIMCKEGAVTAFDLDGGGSCCMVVDLDLVNGVKEETKPIVKKLYRIRKTWDNIDSQLGAYSDLENAKLACKEGYKVFDENGQVVYDPSEKHENTCDCGKYKKEIEQLKAENKQLKENLTNLKESYKRDLEKLLEGLK